MERVPKIDGRVLLNQRQLAAVEAITRKLERGTSEGRPAAEGSPTASAPQPPSKTSISFNVDRKTGDITVIVADAQSGEIIRTIPPEELARLAARMHSPEGLILEEKL